ncbi:MAG TPA: LysM peptidoglycan-binding domain-containing protein [Chloroflexi bacterium]|nr:LysM peptidoglycan-binding domain-containing protein [Chloroflexota bacterium]
MDRLTPRPGPRGLVPERVRRLISYVWIISSLALPVAGVVMVAQGMNARAQLASQTTYQVRAGDTLSAIALRLGVPLDDIVRANGLSDPDRIYVGQVLVIPRPAGSGGEVYTVQAGESLAAIARRFGVSADDIVRVNGLRDRNDIYAGQQLVIPASGVATSPEEVSYTVRRGDSLYRISLVFGVTVDDLLAVNSLASPGAIYPGLELKIPAPRSAPPEVATGPPAGQSGGLSYTVAYGDTLARIAIQYGVTVDGLVAANGLTSPDRIYPGQVLNIPESGAVARPYPARTAVTHTVRTGETLSHIAARYGVTVHSLAVANGITNTARIYPGMVLSIPSAQAGSNSIRYASVGPGLCQGVEPRQSGTGYFIRPVRGYVISQQFHPWHAGIDLATDTGTDVYAADGGTVVFAGWNSAGYGNLIVLDHGNGWRTYYAHLSAVHVNCGEWIPRGSIIGQVGSTGNSTGPHLHFEMLRFGVPVNPAGYIRF